MFCIAYDPNTNTIVGAAYDAFDPDVIVKEFNRMREAVTKADMKLDCEEEKSDATTSIEKEDEESIEKGKHFMVFIFQNWSGNHKSFHFVAARYALANLSARWLRKAIRSITSLLASYFVYSVGRAYDGASENRTWNKRDMTIKLRDLIPELLDSPESKTMPNQLGSNRSVGYTSSANNRSIVGDDRNATSVVEGVQSTGDAVPIGTHRPARPGSPARTDNKSTQSVCGVRTGDERIAAFGSEAPKRNAIANPRHDSPLDMNLRKFKEDELPWDMCIAMKHPSIDWLVIVALSNFSHGVKKEANSFERGNLLGVEGHPMNIYMLRDCYMESPDMKTNGMCSFMCLLFISINIEKLNLLDLQRPTNGVYKAKERNLYEKCKEPYEGIISCQALFNESIAMYFKVWP